MQRLVKVGGCLAWAAWAGVAGAGVTWTAVTRVEGALDAAQQSKIEAWVQGTDAKIMFSESGNPATPAGAYLISRDGGQTMQLVNPEEKSAAKFDLNAIVKLAGSAMVMKVADPQVETLLEEDGGALLGYPTRHLRMRTAYRMEMSFMNMAQQTSVSSTQDVWMAARLGDTGFGAWTRQMFRATGNNDLDKLIQAQQARIKGFPLRMRMTTTTMDSRGRAQTVANVTEVTAIKEVVLPASTFEIPAGYREDNGTADLGGLLGKPGGVATGAAANGTAAGVDVNQILKLLQSKQP